MRGRDTELTFKEAVAGQPTDVRNGQEMANENVIICYYDTLYNIIYNYIYMIYVYVCDDITCANSPTITVAIDTVTGSKNRLILHYYFLRIYEGFNQQEMTNKIWDYSLHTYI